MDNGDKLMEDKCFSSDEDDEDWFFDSIKRYSLLQMFKFEMPKYRLFLSDEKSICVVGKDRRGNDEILELLLPKTLTKPPDQSKLEKSNDLKQVTGGYTTAPLVDMKVLYGKKKFVASQEGLQGIVIYQLGSEKSDFVSVINTVTCNQLEPNLAINEEDKLALVTTNKNGITWIDLTVGKQTSMTPLRSETSDNSKLRPEFLTPDTIAVCSEGRGSTTIYDTRSGSASPNLVCDYTLDGERWTISSNYNFKSSSENEFCKYVGLLSDKGNIFVFDIRNTQTPLCHENIVQKLNLKAGTCNKSQWQLRFSPYDAKRISVSGFDNSIYVYEIHQTSELNHCFTHDGHKQSNHNNCPHTTDHLWYSKNILSASEDKSVHCWQFV